MISATLSAFTAIYHAFGCKTVDPKPVLKSLPKVFGHADKNVRAGAQALTVEFYRWLRDGMKPLFWNDLKPVQQQDLEKHFEKIKDEPSSKPERLLRSQQAAQAAQAATAPSGNADDAIEAGEDEEGDMIPEVMAVDVFPRIPRDFSERLSSTKWKDRKEALDELYVAINFPAIEEGPFDDIVRGLAKCMKDANIAVVTVAANCVELLAKGLRLKFSKYRSNVFTPIMERLKERKQSVTDALAGALDAVCSATSISDCLEETLGFFANKNPQIKLESTRFLIRALKISRQAPSVPEVKQIADSTSKLLTDSQETQRNTACEVLGVLLKVMGERVMTVHFNDLDDIRKAKIKEYADAAEVKAKYKPKVAAPASKPPSTSVQKKPMNKKPASGGAGPSVVKKSVPAAAPTAQDEPVTTPLQTKPTTRPAIARPGAGATNPRALKQPLAGHANTVRKLPTPGANSINAQASPRRVPQPPTSPPPEDSTPAPKIHRGLAARTLTKSAQTDPAPISASSSTTTQPLPSIERIELDELRAEVERLRSTNETLRADHLKLTSQVHELQNQNAQLIEDHTRDVLSIKAKETQLVRARSDAETAEQQASSLQREVERLKRELSRIGRAASPRASEFATAADIFPGGDDAPDGARRLAGAGSRHAVMSPTFGVGKENAAPDGQIAVKSLTRVGSNASDGYNSSSSPRRAMGSGRPLSQPAPPYNVYNSSANGHSSSFSSSHGGVRATGRFEPDARSSVTSSKSLRGDESRNQLVQTSEEKGSGAEGGLESWKRAAEVTQNLKARIELMKARQQQQSLHRG